MSTAMGTSRGDMSLIHRPTGRTNRARPIAAVLLAAAAIAAPALATENFVQVSTAQQFHNALAAAEDGDVILLANGVYNPGATPFTVPLSSSAHFTIRAENPGGAVIDGGSGGCSTRNRLFDHKAQNAWVVFDGLVFRDGCTTEAGTTGGVDVRLGAHATFLDCQFINNAAVVGPPPGSSGGALLVAGPTTHAQFIGCDFSGNLSDSHGGAILMGGGATVFIHDSTFTSNRNNISGHRDNALGGAIHAFNETPGTTTRLYVSNSRFAGNRAGFVGGAIMAKGNFASSTQPQASPTELAIVNSTFVDNLTDPNASAVPSSPTEGGAVMAENDVTLEVHHSRFRGNAAGFGGAISSYRAAVVVRSSEFRDNEAFGDEGSDGQGGAIKAHSNDSCGIATNFPSATVDIANSFFEGNTAQLGGTIFVAGDNPRVFGACVEGTTAQNRAVLTITESIFHGSTVDNFVTRKALGGAVYGSLAKATISDSLFLECSALATQQPPTTIGGGAAYFRQLSRITVTDSTFAGNYSEREGGALYVIGGHIAGFSGNVFFENEVPGGSLARNFRGAAIFTSPDTGLGMTGAITGSTFTDNVGTPIFEHDTDTADRNLVTYSGNAFHHTAFEGTVFFNWEDFADRNVAGLNGLLIDGFDKSPGTNSTSAGSTILTAAVLAAPAQTLPAGAAGDPAGPTDAFLAWAWSGGCARLEGSPLGGDVTGFSSPGTGSRMLEVWESSCSGGADLSATDSITDAGGPSASLVADPVAIDGGDTSELSWSSSGAPFLAGMITHGVDDLLTSPSGNQVVMPTATTRYRLLLVTREGGATQTQGVFVDEPPDEVIFVDGFESGDVSAWN